MNALSPIQADALTTALSTRSHATAGPDAALVSLGVRYDAAVAAHNVACADPADEPDGKLSEATYRVMADLEDEIGAVEATTIAGLRTKAAVVAQQHYRAMEEDDAFGRAKLQLVNGVQALADAESQNPPAPCPAGSDDEIIALCAQLTCMDLSVEGPEGSEATDDEVEEMVIQQVPIINRLCSLTPTTAGGILAVGAYALRCSGNLARADNTGEGRIERMTSLVFRGFAASRGRQRASRIADPDAYLLDLGRQLATAVAAENAAWKTCGPNATDDDPEWIEADRLQHATSKVAKEIAIMTATTDAGLAVKVRALVWCRTGSEPLSAKEREELQADTSDPHTTTDARLIASMLLDLAGRAEA